MNGGREDRTRSESNPQAARYGRSTCRKGVSLALQVEGAHSAFTWGVRDYLLEDGRLAIVAITGASAGAMNATVLVKGWLERGGDGIREQFHTFWTRSSLGGKLSPSSARFSIIS